MGFLALLICGAAILLAKKHLRQEKLDRRFATQQVSHGQELPQGAPQAWRSETDPKSTEHKETGEFPLRSEEDDPLMIARKRAECQMVAFYVWCLEHPNERVDRGDGRRVLFRAIICLDAVFNITDSTKDLALLRKYHKLLDSERLGSSIRRPKDF